MNGVLREILATGTVLDHAGAALPLHSHLPEPEGLVLQDWVRAARPTRILEIGLAYGISTLFLCEALEGQQDVEYHVVDPHQSSQWGDAGRQSLRRAGYMDRVTVHEEPSEVFLPRLLSQGGRLDFAFVDGLHAFDQTMVEFYFLNRLLRPGGLVVFDDIQLPGIRKVVGHVSTLPCYAALPYPEPALAARPARVRRMMGAPPFRLVGFRKVAEDTRPWDWFVDF